MRAALLSLVVGLGLAAAAAGQTRGLPSRWQTPPTPPAGLMPTTGFPAAQAPARPAADRPQATDPASGGRNPAAQQAPQQPGGDASGPPVFFTRLRRFTLPIRVGDAPFRIVAVQLHVSADRGQTWRSYAQQPIQSKAFVFETPTDGEFWFASKTVDDRNTVRPGGPTLAEQRVVVDSQPPQLEFAAAVGGQGEIRCTWQLSDPTLDASTFKLEYQIDPREPWHVIDVPAASLVAERGVLVGQWQWQPEEPSRVMHVRLEISDRAGNRAADTQRVFLPRVAGRPPAGPAGEPGSLPGRALAAAPGEPSQAIAGGSSAAIPWPRNNQLPEHLAAVPGAANQAWTAANRRQTDVERNGLSSAESAAAPSSSQPAPQPPGRLASSFQQPLDNASPSVPGEVRPSVTSQVGEQSAEASSPVARPTAETAWPTLADGEPIRMTAARHFYLDYDLEAVGPRGVQDIELWATRDAGRTWEKWGSDADKQSPFEVQVDQDGLYGFRIVVIAANGLASNPPHSGAPADLWVGVDNSPPVAEITAVIYGTGARVGELDIRWTCTDERLLERPITLSFSDSTTGPWTTIATGLPNSGQYFWRVDATVPQQVYLRLQVADEAGNGTEFTIREPINVAGIVPKGRIQSLSPVR